MDPEELIRGLVSVGLVVAMSLGANCQGAAGHEAQPSAAHDGQQVVTDATYGSAKAPAAVWSGD